MAVVLDTSLLIAAERGQLDLGTFLEGLKDEPVMLAAVTVSELVHGCHRAGSAEVAARRAAWVEQVLELFPVAAFGVAEARRHGELWAALAARGAVIGAHDMLVAATAIAQGAALATLNQKEFARVPGLRLLDVDPGPRPPAEARARPQSR